MIRIEIQNAGGSEEAIDKQLASIQETILFFPEKMTQFMLDAVSDSLEIAYRQAKRNVSGGIIGGNPRLDGRQGLMADAIEKEVRLEGQTIIRGTVGIPSGHTMEYPGYIQEVGYPFPIRSNYPKAMAFLGKDGNKVLTHLTSGVPASQWLTKTWRETKGKMEKKTEQSFEKKAKKLFSGKK